MKLSNLFCNIVKNPNAKRTILMTHGFYGSRNESFNLYKNLESHLIINNNFNIIRFDLSGCGDNPDVSEKRTVKKWVQDVDNITNNIYKIFPNTQINFIGFSLGCALNLLHFEKNKEKYLDSKFVFLAPAFWCDKDMYTKFKSNTNNLSYTRDVDNHTIESLNFNVENILENIHNDILLVHSKEDPVIPVKSTLNAYDKFKSTKKELLLLDDCGHSFRQHENLSQRKKVYERISKFLN